MSRPRKLSAANVIASAADLRAEIEARRAAPQDAWRLAIVEMLEVDGLAHNVATVAAAHSLEAHTARRRAKQIESILEEVFQASFKS